MNGFYDVNRSQLDQAAGEAVIAVRSSFERVGILAAWLTDNPAPTPQTDPLVVDHGYTAVLLDLGLPRGSGLDVLAALRQRYDTTPVLIITARDQLSDPLVVDHGYTEDEAYLLRLVFEQLDNASEGIVTTMEIARKLTGLR